MAGQKVNPCRACGWEPVRRTHRGDRNLDTAVGSVQPVEIVHLLAKRPDLRGLFPLADAVDQAVRS